MKVSSFNRIFMLSSTCAATVLLAACGGGGGETDSVAQNGVEAATTGASGDQQLARFQWGKYGGKTPAPAPAPAPAPTAANHLYVATTGSDSNPGTQAAPFKTIIKASQVAQPDTIVHVAPGTYTGGFTTTASGTASGRIRYLSDTKWGAKLVPPTSGSSTIAWDNRGTYVDIDGFDVDGQSGATWLSGIFNGGSNGSIRNNHVHHLADAVTCTNQGGAGIATNYYYYGENIDIIGNVVHNIGSSTCNYIQGIYVSTPGNVKNNLVYNVGGAAVHLWHDATKINIANNTLVSSGVGIVVGGGEPYHSAGICDYTNVSNNIVFDNTYGISEQGQTGTHNTYTNNLVYQNKTYNWSLMNGLTHTGDVAADPQFVSYSRTGGDYQLKSTSPAVNKGSSIYAPAVDINGTARPLGAAIDIGAYESY